MAPNGGVFLIALAAVRAQAQGEVQVFIKALDGFKVFASEPEHAHRDALAVLSHALGAQAFSDGLCAVCAAVQGHYHFNRLAGVLRRGQHAFNTAADVALFVVRGGGYRQNWLHLTGVQSSIKVPSGQRT